MPKNDEKNRQNPVLAENRKARHDYHIVEVVEAGVELVGTEVKSCRARQIAMANAYVAIEGGQAFMYNVNIAQYSFGNRFNHRSEQKRRLLLHKREILRLFQKVRERGFTIVPLKFYLKEGLVKVEIALCQGKTYGDKREVMREREAGLEARRMIAAHK